MPALLKVQHGVLRGGWMGTDNNVEQFEWAKQRQARLAQTMVISFPAALRNALVQRTLRALRFFLKARWHLERQNRNSLASLRTNWMPCPWGCRQPGLTERKEIKHKLKLAVPARTS